jgi:hypothetical protein
VVEGEDVGVPVEKLHRMRHGARRSVVEVSEPQQRELLVEAVLLARVAELQPEVRRKRRKRGKRGTRGKSRYSLAHSLEEGEELRVEGCGVERRGGRSRAGLGGEDGGLGARGRGRRGV